MRLLTPERTRLSNVDAPRIAIVGFGFSGLMVLANLVQRARGVTLYVVANDVHGLGMAYGTQNPEHLLNVPAAKMGAFADAVDGFFHWLSTPKAALAKQQLGLTRQYAETDFVPRALYAAYLTDIWEETQRHAAANDISIKLVETTATRIDTEGGLAVLTARGDAIAVDKIVLAAGNEVKPILPQVKSVQVIQHPWVVGALDGAKEWPSPVMLMGAGLTAVDMVLSLRRAGYAGEIIAFSRHGRWPQAHARHVEPMTFAFEALKAQVPLSKLVRYVRHAMQQANDWRAAIDALRPHTQALWLRLSAADQKSFVRRLLSIWNVHRHRMAPEIAAVITQETMQQTLRLLAAKKMRAETTEKGLEITLTTQDGTESFMPSRVMNCTGGQLSLAQSSNPLLKQALADDVLEAHANGLGVAVDPAYRAWGAAHPNLYVIGSWMTGQFLESTAVPELRGQAAQIAAAISC